MKTLLVTATLSLIAANASAQDAGLRIAEIFLPHHDQSARVAIWYPSTAAEAPTLYADNPVFQGVAAHMDGPVVSGRHPVVLASPQVRAQVRSLIEPHLPTCAVLGYNEVSKGVEVESLGLVQFEAQASAGVAGVVAQIGGGGLSPPDPVPGKHSPMGKIPTRGSP